MISKTLGERIKTCLTRSQLTEVHLANFLGIPLKRVKGFIKNEKTPDLDEKRRMADYIAGGNYDWLIHGITTNGH